MRNWLAAGAAALVLAFVPVVALAAPASAVPPASAPSFVSLTEPQEGHLRVEWSELSGVTPAVTGYRLARNTSSTGPRPRDGAVHTDVTSGSIRSVTQIGLDVGRTYYLWIRAINADGNGPWSAVQSIVLHGPLTLNTPLPPTLTTTSGTATTTFTATPATATCTADSPDAAVSGTGTTRTLTVTRPAASGEHAVTVTCRTAGQNLVATSIVVTFASSFADGTGAGDGTPQAVTYDSPGESVLVIRDYGLENAPTIALLIGAIFTVALTFYLIRRGLTRARGAMRL